MYNSTETSSEQKSKGIKQTTGHFRKNEDNMMKEGESVIWCQRGRSRETLEMDREQTCTINSENKRRKQEENWGMQDDEDYQDKIATEVPGVGLRGHTENNKFDGNRRRLEQQSEDCIAFRAVRFDIPH